MLVVAVALAAAGCEKKMAPPAPVAEPPPAPPVRAEEPAPAPTGPVRVSEVGFDTPESALYDPEADVYLVSNIGGDPLGKDGNGFISRLGPDGKVQALKWIDGAAEGITLNAPKGLGILGDTLYVADIDVVRTFDRQSGQAKGEIKVKGATFLNDIAVAEGVVYVSDTGMKAGFKPSGSDAVIEIRDGKAKPLVKNKKLSGPNGLAVRGEEVWVVTFGAKTLTPFDRKGKAGNAVELPEGQLDGLVALPDGSFLISSWASKSVYRGKPGGSFAPVVTDVESPADIGVDSKRNKLLIPLFQKNVVEIHDLPEAG